MLCLFSIIDANSSLWQIRLDPASAKLTTFITPFERFKFKHLLFGITMPPGVFQKRICEIIQEYLGIIVGLIDEFVILVRLKMNIINN